MTDLQYILDNKHLLPAGFRNQLEAALAGKELSGGLVANFKEVVLKESKRQIDAIIEKG